MAGVDLAFETFGVATDQPPLIILHGFFASSRNWRQIAGKLGENHRVYVLDMRNHGASAHDPVMNYPVMAVDVLRFIDQQGLSMVNLLGHSMGGKTAMWFALNYPDYLDKLIVVDIAPVSYPHRFASLIAGLKSLPLAEMTNRKQAENHLAESIPDLSYRQFLLQNLVLNEGVYGWRVDLDIFSRTADNIAAFPETQHLQPFSGKALFIAGADSTYVEAEQIPALFPTATLSVIANAGHWLHVQQPLAFIDRVGQFLVLET
ncbi:MAG: alpha/beta fold hydrolase [Methylovulum sp.]|uniref:alpha/beta fold hydrolase n=1 Tax=Methylovulum sp. TaxID=1916980 RepID=UPI00260B2A3B|nr:alpha/beta fold hydrolase [Methylovulum sp.]MDD2722980.1 alpha/beta fold hydrolase [Methylovulum sp.]MDD5123293.1 alpha/beta fold hydrolase [Methylovulum sp.]